MNYEHIQLDPKVNRVRIEKGSPADPARERRNIPQPAADPDDPYRMTHVGWFDDAVTDEKGAERPFGFYIPSTTKTSGSMALILIPGGKKPRDFFLEGSFQETLERYATVGYFASAPDGWDKEDPGFEIDATVKVLGEMKSSEFFPSNSSAVYVMGFEDGANIAVILTILYQSYLAAAAFSGDTAIDEVLLKKLQDSASDCDAYVKRGEVALPAYFTGAPSNALAYFKAACHVGERCLSNGFAEVFPEAPRPCTTFTNDEAASEVWLSSPEDARALGFPAQVEKMVAFVEGYRRFGGVGNGYIRRTVHAEKELAMKKTERTIGGFRRFWYTYEPGAYKRGVRKKYPLIIAIHGFSCSGEFFAQHSCWHRVGEDRDCFVVYPTAYPYKNTPGGSQAIRPDNAVTPHWNASGYDGTLNTDPAGPDEIAFFEELLRVTLEAYPEIDPERIYVSGHSNGGMMTQRLMRMIPERFAGFAPVGAMECRAARMPAPKDGIKRNVWYTIGEYDGAGCSLEGENGNTRTLEMICEANDIPFDLSRQYVSGPYTHTIIRDEDKVPLVRFTGVGNWPHTITPELCFMIYDEFFSRFKRKADGTLVYLA